MEVEIRAKISNLDGILGKLNQLKEIKVKKQVERQVDTYIKHSQDKERVLIFRIRRKKEGAIFTLKTKSQGAKDVIWADIDLPVAEPDKLEDILMNSGYEYVVLIDKVRDSFDYQGYEINIDNIRDLGYFIEIEYQTDTDVAKDQIIESIKKILYSLGLTKDDIIEKGYVRLMEEKELKKK